MWVAVAFAHPPFFPSNRVGPLSVVIFLIIAILVALCCAMPMKGIKESDEEEGEEEEEEEEEEEGEQGILTAPSRLLKSSARKIKGNSSANSLSISRSVTTRLEKAKAYGSKMTSARPAFKTLYQVSIDLF